MRILSHNVYWFQGVPFDTDQPGEPNPAILERLAACYAALAPDVVCLQEIQSETAFETIRSAVGMTGVYVPGGILAQYGGGVLYREGKPVADSSAEDDPAQRVWQIVDVRKKRETRRVANLHLPSSRQLGAEAAAVKRQNEVAALLAHEPEVVAGDWNELPGGPLTELMSGAGYVDAAVHCDSGETPSSIGGKRGDQIWVTAALARRISGYGAVPVDDFAADVPHKTHLSDHLPIWCDIES